MSRILLVDDDEDFRRLVRQTLSHFGHDVVEACNGREALRLQSATEAELVLTDLLMPECDGLETIRAFRSRHPQVKILAMTGGGRFNGDEFLRIAKFLGANRTLLKPFSIQELTDAVQSLLPAPAETSSAHTLVAP